MAKIRDLTGQTFGKLTVVNFAGIGNSRKAMWLCRCECGNEKTVVGSSLTSGLTKSCGCINIKDLSGQTFGKLTVVSLAGSSNRRAMWLCKCECGNEKTVVGDSLTSGSTKSCGCITKPFKDLTGQTFGKLTVVSLAGRDKWNIRTWLCKCECGNEKTVAGGKLTSGGTKSCGCINNIKDLSGQTFGKLTVVNFAGSSKRGHAKWLCKCECGNEKAIFGGHLTSGSTKSCGCITRPFKDLTGQTFGKLTVVKFAGRDKCGNREWLCKCECGNEKDIVGGHLTSGSTKSCGCRAGSKHRQLREKGIFTKRTNKYGYVIMHYPEHANSRKGGNICEHTYVMSEHLGRPLKPNENVHHINGVRDDNRIENLELWCKSQPCGQRVNEKQAFYVEFISEYNGEFLQDAKTEHLQGALEAIKIELERRNKCNTQNENTQSSLRQVQLNG